MKEEAIPLLLTCQEAAAYVGCSRDWIRQLVLRDVLTPVYLNPATPSKRSRRYRRDDLDRYVADLGEHYAFKTRKPPAASKPDLRGLNETAMGDLEQRGY